MEAKQPHANIVQKHHLRDSSRRLLNACFAFLAIFLVVRVLFLEPFGVPTGSMATTLHGNHRECPCPRCGFPVVVGDDGDDFRFASAVCPNCGQRGISHATMPTIPGDRLLVDKNIFQLRSPRRWEVCVFRCPVDDTKPYVKRVVGMPGETLQLRDGDVFADDVLQRKTLKQCRECWILAFDQNFAPQSGWSQRWLDEVLTTPPRAAVPAGDGVLDGQSIVLATDDSTVPARGLTFRNWNLDRNQEEPFDDWLAYNGGADHGRQLIHDFAVTFTVDVTSGSGSFACRLFDGLDAISVEFPIGSNPSDQTSFGRDGGDPASAPLKLEIGKTYRVEFSFIDRRCSLAINGKLIPPAIDLREDNLGERKGVSRPVQFGIRGGRVVIRDFKLFRDVYYRADARNATHSPHKLGGDQYFMAGDNSNSSTDSRVWAIPGVPERAFIGKPFLIHQPLKLGTTTWGGPPRHYQAIDWDRLRWLR